MTIEDYEKKRSGHTIRKYPFLKSLITRSLITIILVFSTLIITNYSTGFKQIVKKYLFQTDFKFSTINTFFNKYFLDLNSKKEKPVNKDDSLDYESAVKYKDGIKLPVSKSFAVSLLESGIVVFIGEKDDYKNTVIVQQSNGIDVWYGNIEDINIKLYDYVEKGTILGNANENLFLVFQKDGKYVDYKTIIK